ncbi:MAG TPA: class A beta-lactamase [Longimicrobiales bacterium]|nr:class A beta-lactamase [Longimicrobiales bacterium]
MLRPFPSRRRHPSAAPLVAALLLVPGLTRADARAQAPSGTGPNDGLPALRAELLRLSAGVDGTVGVGVHHLETGVELYVNGDEAFPMASTYKVPVAVELLRRVDRGEVRLDSLVAVEAGDLHPGSGVLEDLFDDPGVLLSVKNLMDLMLQISDNSATDLTMEIAGGADGVTGRMRSLGLDGIRVDRPTVELIADYVGVEELPPPDRVTKARWEELAERVPEAARDSAADAFDRDARDTATPRHMARLLRGIWEREYLSDTSSALLLEIMYACRTGEGRLKGLLPEDTEVAHKTGTIGRTTNDVGIVDLPHGAGHVVIAVFVKEAEAEIPERERVIAEIARAVHDYFLFRAVAEE